MSKLYKKRMSNPQLCTGFFARKIMDINSSSNLWEQFNQKWPPKLNKKFQILDLIEKTHSISIKGIEDIDRNMIYYIVDIKITHPTKGETKLFENITGIGL